MKFDRSALRLYLVTDRAWLNGNTLKSQVECALRNGATFVQLREKDLSEDEFLKSAKELCSLCRQFNVPFIVNDNVEIAKLCDADGIHVGQRDMAAGDVRAQIGPDKILGVSAQTVEQAKAAEAAGADYLGVGAMFHTDTKTDADAVSFDTLREICTSVSIPVVAIGGITRDNILKLSGSNIAGVAVVSAILASDDIAQASRTMRALSDEVSL